MAIAAQPENSTSTPKMEALFVPDSMQLLLLRAEAGDTPSQCRAGKLLAQGTGDIAADPIEASKWLDLCIRHPDHERDDEARELMDDLIETAGWDMVGEGKYRAFQWQQRSLNAAREQAGTAGDSTLLDLAAMDGDAAFALGMKFNDGVDMPVDYEKALRCFERAAEVGIPEAAFNLGVAYYAGKGVKADPSQALDWFMEAIEGGFAKAATMMAIMAARGHGMDPDINLSLQTLKLAADLGDPQAPLIGLAIASGAIPQ
jgi:TPR repeat protein